MTSPVDRQNIQYDILLCVTKLLEDAFDQLRQLPESVQDGVARAVIFQLEEQPEPGDLEAIEAGWHEYQRGDLITHQQLRHEMGLPHHHEN